MRSKFNWSPAHFWWRGGDTSPVSPRSPPMRHRSATLFFRNCHRPVPAAVRKELQQCRPRTVAATLSESAAAAAGGGAGLARAAAGLQWNWVCLLRIGPWWQHDRHCSEQRCPPEPAPIELPPTAGPGPAAPKFRGRAASRIPGAPRPG